MPLLSPLLQHHISFSQRQQELETAWGNGLFYQWATMTAMSQTSLEQSWGAQHSTQLCMAASKRQLITTQCKATTAEIPATFRCMQQLFPRLFVDGSVCCSPTFSSFEHPLTFASETDAESLRPEAYCGPQELSQNQRQCHVVFSSAEISRALAWKRGEHLHTDTLKMPTQSQAWELQACQGRIIPHVEKQMKSQKERKKKSLINQ